MCIRDSLYCELDNQGEPKSEQECKKRHIREFKERSQVAKTMGTGVIMTEFGSVGSTPKGLTEIDSVLQLTDNSFMSWAYWQYKYFNDITSTTIPTENQGLYFIDGKPQYEKIKLFARPYLPEICGKPISGEYNPKRNYAKFVYRAGECGDFTSVLYYNCLLYTSPSPRDS
eukprot:TRINITY_DN1819_c0_g1_i5.p2 TRINITY_DN1819_c0_g1~~TRINITY_DN1819_c0_g1_i5.p2  ORF type:complete len:171 (+),score=46.94 TRINITY_DN1819_c0_g1_i5:64-576(+)